MIKYVAFLRGINVGGKKLIKMEELSRAFGSLGFKHVRTFIASGNVLFEAAETDADVLARKIEKKVLKSFDEHVTVILQTVAELEKIVRRNPFRSEEHTSELQSRSDL